MLFAVRNMVVQWLALLPQSMKVLGSNQIGAFLYEVCMFSLCLHEFL